MGRLLVAAIGVLAVVGSSFRPSWASCAPPLPADQAIAQAKVVFMGTVAALKDGDARRAVVRVEEIRKGGPLPDKVEVVGTPSEGPRTLTSVDRTFAVGAPYLFVPYNDASPFEDNACSATAQLERTASAEVTQGGPAESMSGRPEGSPVLPWILGVGVLLGAGALVVRGVRARR